MCKTFIFSVICLTFTLPFSWAEGLDDLLKTDKEASLAENAKAREKYSLLKQLLASKKYKEATVCAEELSALGFLDPLKREACSLSIAVLADESSRAEKKEEIKKRYRDAIQTIRGAENEIDGLRVEATHRMRNGTATRTVKLKMEKRGKDLAKLIAAKKKSLVTIKAEAQAFDSNRSKSLAKRLIKFSNALDTLEDVDVAILLNTSYLDKIKEDSAVTELNVKLGKLKKDMIKIDLIVSAIEKSVRPLIDVGKLTEAQDKLSTSLAKVRASELSELAKDTIPKKLSPLELEINQQQELLAAGHESQSSRLMELKRRLLEIEKQLNIAQSHFEKAVSTIDSSISTKIMLNKPDGRIKLTAEERLKLKSVTTNENFVKASSIHQQSITELTMLQKISSDNLTGARLGGLLKRAQSGLSVMQDLSR